MRQHLLQHVREILDDDDAFRAGVLQLMFEFARRIQGIGVDHHHAGAQYPEQGDRILQDVGHHQGDPVAGEESGFLLQPGGEGPAERIQLGEAQGRAHVGIGRLVAVSGDGLLEQFPKRGILGRIDVGGYARRILLQPSSFHAGAPRFLYRVYSISNT